MMAFGSSRSPYQLNKTNKQNTIKKKNVRVAEFDPLCQNFLDNDGIQKFATQFHLQQWFNSLHAG